MANTVILQSLKPQAISIIEFVKLNISGTSGKSQSNTVSYLLNTLYILISFFAAPAQYTIYDFSFVSS